ncbi:unnamed protein product [Schistocephalus solidus]|uniref:C2H2-type domain-containing protein n=1 Tax=Schistocephalus solidus TaxID=70667 RepID=A0A3P7CAM6_SCHSO|nr:unnamed protein product [Schistocephalus solidus]
MLDYVLVRRPYRQDVLVTKVIHNADGWRITASSSPSLGSDFNPDEGPKPLPTTCYLQHHYRPQYQRWDSVLNCPHCDRILISCIGLVVHLRIHDTETGEPVLGEPTHSRDQRLHCYLCPRAFTHRIGLFGRMRIHDSGIHHNADNTDTPLASSTPAIPTTTTTNDIPPAPPNFSCLHCTRNFTSRIGLVCHLQIHCMEAGEPVPRAPTYSRLTRLHCPHCSRTFTHRMGLLAAREVPGDADSPLLYICGSDERLWKIMQQFGYPERFTHMVRQLDNGRIARVSDHRTVSEACTVTNGVKQGCFLTPTLFSLMFSAPWDPHHIQNSQQSVYEGHNASVYGYSP